MKYLLPLSTVIAAAALTLAGCAERRTAEQDQPAPRPPTTAEVPPTDTPAATPAQTAPTTSAQPPRATPESTGETRAAVPSATEPVPPATAVAPPTETPEAVPATPTAPTPAPGEPLEVIATDSGLIIEVLREGTGPVVRGSDAVVVHYHGTLANGNVFDSTRDREPISLYLSQTIRGWQEGVPGMKVGGKRRLIVPPELAYGSRARPNIPANSMLIFEIEIVDLVR